MAGLKAECKKYDAVANGTFMTFRRQASAMLPTGEEFQDVPDAGNKSLVRDRGGVAVLDDGTVLLGQQHGNGLDEIQTRFGCHGRTVVGFLGGGALIVSRGLKVASNGMRDDTPAVRPEDREEDLSTAQHFHRSPEYGSGINAQQFHSAQHSVLAVAGGQAFLIITPFVSGVELQRDLVNAGVQTAVKFDGGGGFFFCRKPGASHGPGNVTGFGVFIRPTPK